MIQKIIKKIIEKEECKKAESGFHLPFLMCLNATVIKSIRGTFAGGEHPTHHVKPKQLSRTRCQPRLFISKF